MSIVREVTVVWGRVYKTVVWDVPFKCRMESTGWEELFVVFFKPLICIGIHIGYEYRISGLNGL